MVECVTRYSVVAREQVEAMRLMLIDAPPLPLEGFGGGGGGGGGGTEPIDFSALLACLGAMSGGGGVSCAPPLVHALAALQVGRCRLNL